MKTYVLPISEYFPKTHPRAGEPTESTLRGKTKGRISFI